MPLQKLQLGFFEIHIVPKYQIDIPEVLDEEQKSQDSLGWNTT